MTCTQGDALKEMTVDTTVLGLSDEEAKSSPYIASMGIYVFRKDVLTSLLSDRFPTANDFGSEVIPQAKDVSRSLSLCVKSSCVLF